MAIRSNGRQAARRLLVLACCAAAACLPVQASSDVAASAAHISRMSMRKWRAASGRDVAAAGSRRGGRQLAAEAGFEYWELPEEEDIRVPALSFTNYDTSKVR